MTKFWTRLTRFFKGRTTTGVLAPTDDYQSTPHLPHECPDCGAGNLYSRFADKCYSCGRGIY